METRDPTDIDRLVSERILARRNELDMSQPELAERVGVTFQQVQKYENGKNRISAGRLYEVAKALGVTKVELEELLARADFITLHVPQIPMPQAFGINRPSLAAAACTVSPGATTRRLMKPGAPARNVACSGSQSTPSAWVR